MIAIHPAIIMSLGMCIVLLIITVFEGKWLKLLQRATFGMLLLVAIQYFIPAIGLGLHWWSVAIACIFGVPGIAIMYGVRLLLIFL